MANKTFVGETINNDLLNSAGRSYTLFLFLEVVHSLSASSSYVADQRITKLYFHTLVTHGTCIDECCGKPVEGSRSRRRIWSLEFLL